VARYFSPEYRQTISMANPRWRMIRRLTFALTLGRDVLCPFLPAQNADHLSYRRLGHELPLLDLVPLHTWTHFVVTWLRRWGLKAPVNFVLRTAYAGWIATWIYLGLLIGQMVGVWHGIPLPSLDTPARVIASGHHLINGLINDVSGFAPGLVPKS